MEQAQIMLNTVKAVKKVVRAANKEANSSEDNKEDDTHQEASVAITGSKKRPNPSGSKTNARPNKCIHIMKSGKTAGQPCGTSCADKYCATHAKQHANDQLFQTSILSSISTGVVTVSGPPVINASSTPLTSTAPLTTTTPTTITSTATTTRKIQKKVPGWPKEAQVKEDGKVTSKLMQNIHELQQQRVSSIVVKKNQWDNYEGPSGLLINPDDESVYGKQLPDGTKAPLTLNDIERCKELGLKYQLPDKLGEVSKKIADLSIEDQENDYEDISDDEA